MRDRVMKNVVKRAWRPCRLSNERQGNERRDKEGVDNLEAIEKVELASYDVSEDQHEPC